MTLIALALAAVTPAAAQPKPEAPGPALSDEAEHQRVFGLYEAGRYEECARLAGALLDLGGTRPLAEPRVIEATRLLHAACLLGAGDPASAAEPLRRALRDNPQMAPPDALAYPDAVIELWARVRDATRSRIVEEERARAKRAAVEARRRADRERAERERVARLEQLAARETELVRRPRWLAFVPFGVGQLSNDQPALGATLLGVQVGLAGATLAGLLVQLSAYRQIAEARNSGRILEPERTNAQLSTAQDVIVFGGWGFVGVAALGVVHANLTWVGDERVERRRPLPPVVRRPTTGAWGVGVGVAPGGVSLGVAF
ncbi:MAG: hypothetical protein IT376_18690 [Polyangiaceae bacterium]|nr:hypothetical protein [Polyangiaceae bacterium]